MAAVEKVDADADKEILRQAYDEFDLDQAWESDFRALSIADTKFANGDSDNNWQWHTSVLDQRGASNGNGAVGARPTLTVNKVATLVLLITNDARKNKPNIKIRPTGEHDSFEAAQILEGIIRYIERASKAQAIYDEAFEAMVEGGVAYWRVIEVYTDDDSFDQEIRLEPVRNHLNVYLDRNIKQRDGSDAKHGFIFDELTEKEFKRLHPGVDVTVTTGLDEAFSWVKEGNIRVAEYYRIVEIADELIYLEIDGIGAKFKRSEVPPQFKEALADAEINPSSSLKTRKIKRKQLEWYKIAGDKIIDRRKLKGNFIPIIRLVGREKVIEGRLERKGHVRPLKDAQRMYNFNTSANVEFGASQTKTPFLATAEAIEGNQQMWNNLNTKTPSLLIWRRWDSQGREIPEPRRIDPPVSAPAALEGMKIAAAEMEMASGQAQSQQVNPSIERTPKAIDAREHKSETSVYHFFDNLSIAIAHTGRVIVDKIPHVYDTDRVIQILARDGSQKKVNVAPSQPTPYKEEETEDEEIKRVLFNPSVGKYEVESDIGPAYATQRAESWNAFVQIITNSPDLTMKIGDLGFKAADFPMAEEIAERLRRDIRATAPWLLDDEETGPFIKNLQTQLQKLTQDVQNKDQSIAELLTKLAESKIGMRGKDEKRGIEVYRAETDRIVGLGNTVGNMGLDVLKPVIRQVLADMLGIPISAEAHDIQSSIDLDTHISQNPPPEPPAANGAGQ